MHATTIRTDLSASASTYCDAAIAPSTASAYASDWRHFDAWCSVRATQPLPAAAATVANYVADMARWAAPATINRRLAAITFHHQRDDHQTPVSDPAVRTVMRGLRRTLGTAQVQKTPALTEDIRSMVGALPNTILGTRDRALLLIGFAGAFRRSELVALDVADIDDTSDGLVVTIRRSKTDQEGAGRTVGIPYGSNPATCPVRAYRAWLDAGLIEDGPVFRSVTRHAAIGGRLSSDSVALVVKRSAESVGLDPTRYSGHSLRSGLATSAARAGASERAIMDQTGHRSTAMVRRYIRTGSLFNDNAAAGLGL